MREPARTRPGGADRRRTSPPRPERAPSPNPPRELLLQREVGNHATGRLLLHGLPPTLGSAPPVGATGHVGQALEVGAPGDPAEREAERIATSLAVPTGPVTHRDPGGTPGPERASTSVGSPRPDHGPGRSPSLEPGLGLGPGLPLDPARRAFFERRFGIGLGDVRVHRGAAAAAAAELYHANAFAVGSHIVFGAGRYAPGSPAGARLLAHELTHVVQQSRARPADVTAGGPVPVRVQQQRGPYVEREMRPSDMQDYTSYRHRMPSPPRKPYYVFEVSHGWTTELAERAFRDYALLKPDEKRLAFEISYKSGQLQKALAALGPDKARTEKYSGSVQELLRWVEEREATEAFGMNEEAMAEKQAGFLKSDPSKASSPGWGGTKKTRWGSLLPKARAEWTKRGKAAIKTMAAHAKSRAPKLGITAATFELEFDKIDRASLGAIASVGSKPGKTLFVGFEFIAVVEVDPAYAMSTVVHELFGHPAYDPSSDPTLGGRLYRKAAKIAKEKGVKLKDMKGTESFDYYQSEIYSLLQEIPYWTKVSKADEGKSLNVAGSTTTPEEVNYDPRGAIKRWLREIRNRWEPSVGAALLTGFHRRIKLDPTIPATVLAEFEKLLRDVYGKKADPILRGRTR